MNRKLIFLIISFFYPYVLISQTDSSNLNFENKLLIKKDFSQLDSSGLSRFPLNVGNKWLYRVNYYAGPGINYTYSYSTRTVDSSKTINGKIYYKIAISTGSGLYRFSSEDNKLYRYDNGSDQIIMDFNKTAGDTFLQYIGPNAFRAVTVLEGIESHFNNPQYYKGYEYNSSFDGYTKELYFNYLGPLFFSYFRNSPPEDSKSKAINVLLYDSSGNAIYYTYGLKPSFGNVNPILSISNPSFQMNFQVTHPYSVEHSLPWIRYNFISNVRFESYYQKGDSVISRNPVNLSHDNWPNYNITLSIDTSLMSNGFSFNYRFVASDKQIIPEVTYSPDSGYYKCIWQPLSIDNNSLNNIFGFNLSQNYPNPFNPSTMISWQSPVSGWQTLMVYDILGNEVATLVDEFREAGRYEVEFNAVETRRGLSLPSGVYFYQLKTGNFIETKKMILTK